ncbi:MAG: helix-hairpin-helix domain-containing protein [Firmicutes bacterium]|nr:helix-hairpin-helix domain-containing protein [Bacillota bacterium]
METWKTKLEEVLRFCRTNEKYVKIAVIALVVVAALVFFGMKGEKKEILVTQNGQTSSMISDGETSVEETAGTALPVTQIVVDLSGCVKKPGVYTIDEGSRLYEVIELAGGLLENADTASINQAEILYDGQKIMIPEVYDGSGNGGSQGGGSLPSGLMSDGRVNINQADSSGLQEIPGVGPSTAEKIIQYRESHGRFKSIEDIKNVDGIGDKTFEKMKDMIAI